MLENRITERGFLSDPPTNFVTQRFLYFTEILRRNEINGNPPL